VAVRAYAGATWAAIATPKIRGDDGIFEPERDDVDWHDRPALRPVRGDQEITISSFVRDFRGPDALIEGAMVDSAGKTVSRCLMTVAHIDKKTSRATAWPPDLMELFFEREPV
jgi:hypothetical protein